MALIKKYNKDNDTTYVYESVSYWDKEKQQPRSKRKLIGKIDKVTGEIVPTGGRTGRKVKENTERVLPLPADQMPTEDFTSSDPAENSDKDYKILYESALQKISEQDALIRQQQQTISLLAKETDSFLKKMNQLLSQE